MDELLEKKNRVIEIWVNNPFLSNVEICRMADISEVTFWRYRQEPEFMELYEKKCKERFNALRAKAVENVQKKMNEGDWQATKYVLDNGGYAGTQKIEVKDTTITVELID